MLKLLQIFPLNWIDFFFFDSKNPSQYQTRKAFIEGGRGIKKRLQIDVKNDDSLDLEWVKCLLENVEKSLPFHWHFFFSKRNEDL